MRGIDLYKELLEDDAKYHGKRFKYDNTEINVSNGGAFIGFQHIFSFAPVEITRFLNAELTEVVTPIPWQECIQKWSENPTKYKVKVVNNKHTLLYGEDGISFKDEKGRPFNINEILYGEWYLIEKQTC